VITPSQSSSRSTTAGQCSAQTRIGRATIPKISRKCWCCPTAPPTPPTTSRGFAGQGIEMELPQAKDRRHAESRHCQGRRRATGSHRRAPDAGGRWRPPIDGLLLRPTACAVSGDLPMCPGVGDEQGSISLYWRIERCVRIAEWGSTFDATGQFDGVRRELAPKMPPDTLLERYVPAAAWILFGILYCGG
jgi:hypothetical protein